MITPEGAVVSVNPLADGTYSVFYWDRTQTDVDEGSLIIAGGIAQNMRSAVFSVKNEQVTSQVYQIEALDLNEDGIVGIKASCFPVDAQGCSLVAADVLNASTFEVIGQGAD